MPFRINQFTLPVAPHSDDLALKESLARYLDIPSDQFLWMEIKKKSLDARQKRKIVYHFQIDFEVSSVVINKMQGKNGVNEIPGTSVNDSLFRKKFDKNKISELPIIIGSGPAGIFAAYVLAESGIPSIIIERGEPVEKRFRTVHKLRARGVFNNESNYCFGEGGAGTFSDGKLTCGRNHPFINYLFRTWVKFGAPNEILYDAHPHIGTDYLMRITVNMRKYIEELGAKFIFGTKLIGWRGDNGRHFCKLSDNTEITTDKLIVAIGHSARDTYKMFYDGGLAIAQKPFAIGVRLEHPQQQIDQIQYGSCEVLPPAEYKLAFHQGERGIWTFCMCPGGFLLPTGAQAEHLAINGMSYHGRKSGFANAAVVVNILREDYDKGHPLDGIQFQRQIEQKAFRIGGSNYYAPAQRLKDFILAKESKGVLSSTYRPGINSARLDLLLPEMVTQNLRQAFIAYDKKMKGFICDNALVIGTETKTSSPLIMQRNSKLESISHPGLYPTGEGAGFAGGIVSAALDGLRVGMSILENLQSS